MKHLSSPVSQRNGGVPWPPSARPSLSETWMSLRADALAAGARADSRKVLICVFQRGRMTAFPWWCLAR